MVISVQVPPVGNRTALEQNDAAIGYPYNCRSDHYEANDPDVAAIDSYPQQEETNGDLKDRGGESVKDFTKEPVLKSGLCTLICENRSVSASTMDITQDLKDEVRCEETKRADHCVVIHPESFHYTCSMHLSVNRATRR